jgi:2-polyprenyl-3-methyl-5-hydroxy-6-metoxy-1,4-benzoquinol methylase
MDKPIIWDRSTWDEQYRTGRWDYLADVAEMGRYALIAAYVQRFVPSGRVFDVGCGEGLLYGHLPVTGRFEYTGLDFSPTAIAKAAARNPQLRLFAAAAEEFVDPTGLQFDAIVFNEILYALTDPASVLQRYRGMLAPRGVVVISTFLPEPKDAAWFSQVQQVWELVGREGWPCLDLSQVWNARVKISWRVAVLQPNPV